MTETSMKSEAKAKEIVHDLERKLVAAKARLMDIGKQRAETSLPAELGEVEAMNARVLFDREVAAIEKRIADLSPAIAAAKKAVPLACEEDARLVEKAEKARPIYERLAKRGALIDAGLRQAIGERAAILDDLRELARLGAPTPSGGQVEVAVRIQTDAALAGMHKEIRPVAPDQRSSFASLCAGWARMAATWADKALGDQTSKAA